MGAGHLAAAFINPPSSPVLAMGSTVIDATPTPVKEWAVRTFGTADKPILVLSVGVVTVVGAVATGLLARRHRTAALIAIMALGGIAALAATARPAAGSFDALPGLIAGLAGMLVLSGLLYLLEGQRAANAGHPAAESLRPAASRRVVLAAAAGVAALSAGAAALGHRIGRVPTLPASLHLPAPAEPARALPAGIEGMVRGVSDFRTPNSDFYRIDTALVVPRVDAESWTLTIDGEVDNRVRVTYAELLAMPMIERDVTLTCVSNEVGGPYISGARWLGVRTADLLRRAGIHSGADQILSTSADGFTVSTPVQALTDSRDAMLAVAMNGVPLPAEHGFPVRLVTPGLYGFVGCTKWITRMTATTYAARQAYWTERGWASHAPILTESRIDVPRGGSTVAAGKTYVGGVAWAQGRGIKGVQVRIDRGQWTDATLGPDGGIDYWRQWYLPWDAPKGRHTLTVRATDNTGQQQTPDAADPFPSGATGWHSIVVSVR
jgi:DMSO/TMAO reductase YedYZ molybdopterin-dependent catalytic subunit